MWLDSFVSACLVFLVQGFSPGAPVFLPPQKTKSPNSNSTRIENQIRPIDFLSKYCNLLIYYDLFGLVLFVRDKNYYLLCVNEESITMPHLKIKQISIGFS